MVGGGVIESSGVWEGWDHPSLEPELCSVGTVWSLPLLVHRQTHSHSHTDTHMHRHMDMDRHVSVHRRHISTTHSHACLRVHTCALTSHSHAARVCTRQNSVCLCTHRKTRMHTHTHTLYNTFKCHPEQVWCEHSPGGLSAASLRSGSHMHIHACLCFPVDITSMCLTAEILGAEGWATCLR